MRSGSQLGAKHWPFLVVFALAAALRVLVTLAYWPALELGGDSYSYLDGAHSLTPGTFHPLGYSLFLKALSIFGSMGAAPIAQHLIGLALGVLVYALLLRLGVRRGLALLATLPVLLDGYQLDIEQFIMAEALVDALALVAFALLLWNDRISPRRAAGIGALLAAATLTRVAVVPLLAVAGVYLVGRRWWRALAAYTGVALAMLIGYGCWYGINHGAFAFSDYTGYLLYGRVAPLATCDYALPPKVARLCPRQSVARRTKNPEFYIWHSGSPLYRRGLGDHHQRNLLARRFALDVIEHQPLAYAGAVFSDTWHYFTPGRWMTAAQIELQRFRFPNAAMSFNTDYFHVTLANWGFDGRPVHPDPTPSLYGFLRGYQSVVYTQGPLLLAALIGGLLAALGLLRKDGRRRQARWAAAVFATGGFLIVFASSMTAAFSYRYGIPLLILLPPGGIIGADLGLDALLARIRQRHVAPANWQEAPRQGIPAEAYSGTREGGPNWQKART